MKVSKIVLIHHRRITGEFFSGLSGFSFFVVKPSRSFSFSSAPVTKPADAARGSWPLLVVDRSRGRSPYSISASISSSAS